MKFPDASELTEEEKNLRVSFAEGDVYPYPGFMDHPLEVMIQIANACLLEKFSLQDALDEKKIDGHDIPFYIWDNSYDGVLYWGVPEPAHRDQQQDMMKMMQTQFMYFDKEKPEAQVMRLFSLPTQRKLARRSKSNEHKQLGEKVFVLKISMCPFNTSKHCEISRGSKTTTWATEFRKRSGDKVRVWRLVSCYGNMTFANLHDRILGPAMGWARHYHAYMFTDNESGACFGPKQTTAVDAVHIGQTVPYYLSDTKYSLCHILRKVGDRMIYTYDLGDTWMHHIEVVQIADLGDPLKTKNTGHQEIDMYFKMRSNENFKVEAAQLYAGELNCAPEDSLGCGMGCYGTLLNKGRECNHYPKAVGALNWKQFNIRNPYDFDLAAHQKRLKDAVGGRGSAKTGQKKFSSSLFGDDNREGPGIYDFNKKRSETVLKSGDLVEKVRIKPDKKSNAVCSTCGRQPHPSSDAPLKRCTACRAVWYCNAKCQRMHWKEHKAFCKKSSDNNRKKKKKKVKSNRA